MNLYDIEQADQKNGGNWFAKDTMKFFKSIVYGPVVDVVGGGLFVSSEKGFNQRRAYSVRMWDGANVKTVGEFCGYSTQGQAFKAAIRAAKEVNAPVAVGVNPEGGAK